MRLINAVSCNVHHAIAERGADEDTYGGDEQYRLERSRLCPDGRLKKVYRIVADADHKVEYREYEQEDDDAQIDCFHKYVFDFRCKGT